MADKVEQMKKIREAKAAWNRKRPIRPRKTRTSPRRKPKRRTTTRTRLNRSNLGVSGMVWKLCLDQKGMGLKRISRMGRLR
jgi:hypothetical protein